MDNGLLKNKKQIEDLMGGCSNSFEIIYLPSYSPLINPLQNVFRKLKNQIMTKKFSNNKDLSVFLTEELKKYEMQSLKKYFEEADVYINLAIQKKSM